MAEKKEFIVRNGLNVETGNLTINDYSFSSTAGANGQFLRLIDGVVTFENVIANPAFIDITDSPNSYVGFGNRIVKVNATEDGIEFGVDATVSTLRENFTGDGTTTDFGLSANIGSINDFLVFVDAVIQVPGSNFGLASANTLQFTTAPANNAVINVYGVGRLQDLISVSDGTITTSKLAPAIYNRDTFTGNGSNTTFSLSRDPISETAPLVIVEGVIQDPDTNYNIDLNSNPKTITFTEAVADTASITVVYLAPGSGTLTTVSDGTITEAKIAANSVSTIKIQDGAVTGAKLEANSVTSDKLAPLADIEFAGNSTFGTTLFVNDTNGRVGIGNTTPGNTFVIQNPTGHPSLVIDPAPYADLGGVYSEITLSGSRAFFGYNSTDPYAGGYVRSDANYNFTVSANNGYATVFVGKNGNIGIGNSSTYGDLNQANSKLEVQGDINLVSGNVLFDGVDVINYDVAHNFRIGANSVANTGSDIAIGKDTHVSGGTSVGIGLSTIASASHSMALGANATAAYANSVAIGRDATTASLNEIRLGGHPQTRVTVPTAAANSISSNNQLITKIWAENNLLSVLNNPSESIGTGDGVTTTYSYSGADATDHPGGLMVSVDGILQDTGVYEANSSTITFGTAPSDGSIVVIRNFLGSTAATSFAGTILPSSMGNFWVFVSTTATAQKFKKYFVDTSSGPFTIDLPQYPSMGDEVTFHDVEDTWDTNNLTLDGNGNLIDGANTFICDIEGSTAIVAYTGSQWRVLST